MDDERMRGISSFVDFVRRKEEAQTLSMADRITMSSVVLSLLAITQEINAVLKAIHLAADKKSEKELLEIQVREMCKDSRASAYALQFLLELHAGNLRSITKTVRDGCDKFVFSDEDIMDAKTIIDDMKTTEDSFVIKFGNMLIDEIDEEEHDTSIPTA